MIASLVASTPTTATLPVEFRAATASTAPSAIWSLVAKTALRSGCVVRMFSITDMPMRTFAVGRLNGHTLNAGRGGNRLTEARETVVMSPDPENPANHRDFPFAAEKFDDMFAGEAASAPIVGSHEARLGRPIHIGIEDDYGNPRCLRPFQQRQDLRYSRRRHGQRGNPLGDLVFENCRLLVDVDFALGSKHRQSHSRNGARSLFGARFHALPPFTVERFADERDVDRLGPVGSSARDRQQASRYDHPDCRPQPPSRNVSIHQAFPRNQL